MTAVLVGLALLLAFLCGLAAAAAILAVVSMTNNVTKADQ